ncbi:MAG: T9SS type A sorting domain-containing protein [Candidatus Stahlbacteria bacterium]|nr:T9SS type A sorting domain-containing protein [Candidatus Stahlbacteria bacterium]
MKKVIFIIGLMGVIVSMPLNSNSIKTSPKQWTILVFINGDNNLEDAGIDDMNEMERAIDTTNYNVIVEFDRIPGYDTSNGNWTTTRRYFITPDTINDTIIRSTLIADLGEINMGNPNSIIDFATWGIENYPAEHYSLIIWDHGNGWYKVGGAPQRVSPLLKGISSDETDGDNIGVANGEYAFAMDSIATFLGKKIDILGNDACFMGMQEVAYEVKDYVDFIVFSEYSEPWDGYPYDDILTWLTANPIASPKELAQIIVDKYVASYSGGSQGNDDITQSAVLLDSQFTHTSQCINRFAEELMKVGGRSEPQIDSAYWKTQYLYVDSAWRLHIDIYHFALNIRDSTTLPIIVKEWSDSVIQAIDSAVVREGHHTEGFPLDNCYGLAIYYPNDTTFIDTTYIGLKFAEDLPHWWEFIRGRTIGIEEDRRQITEDRRQKLDIYPNPFIRSAVIGYRLSVKGNVSLVLYDITGRLVKTIYSGIQEKGYHEAKIQGEETWPLQAGIYFIRLDTGEFKTTRKLTIL